MKVFISSFIFVFFSDAFLAMSLKFTSISLFCFKNDENVWILSNKWVLISFYENSINIKLLRDLWSWIDIFELNPHNFDLVKLSITKIIKNLTFSISYPDLKNIATSSEPNKWGIWEISYKNLSSFSLLSSIKALSMFPLQFQISNYHSFFRR